MKKIKLISYILTLVLLLQISGCSLPKNINSPSSFSSIKSNSESSDQFNGRIENSQKGKFQNGFDLIDVKYKVDKIDFKKANLKSNQDLFIYYCDDKQILYAIIDYIEDYYIPQELCVWNINSKKVTNKVKINKNNTKKSVASAAILNDDIVYSTTDWNIQSDNKRIWEINLAHNGENINLDKGICRDVLDQYIPLLYKMGGKLAYTFENIDMYGIYTYGAKVISNGKVGILDCHTGDLSEKHSDVLFSCRAASNENNFVYFIAKGKDAFFYIVDLQGQLKIIPLKGKIYTYALLRNALFQSAVIHENEDNQMYKIYIDDYFGNNQYDINAYKAIYRPESNGDNIVLAVNYLFDIYLFGVKNERLFRSKINIPEFAQKPVEFFNIDKNSYYMFFSEDYVLYKITFDL